MVGSTGKSVGTSKVERNGHGTWDQLPVSSDGKGFWVLVFWPYAFGDTFLREMNKLDFFLSLLSDPPFGSRIYSHWRARSDLWKVCAEKVYLQWDMRFRRLDGGVTGSFLRAPFTHVLIILSSSFVKIKKFMVCIFTNYMIILLRIVDGYLWE